VLQTTTSLIAEWPEDRPGEIRILTLLHEGVRQRPQPDQYHRLSDTAFAGLRESKTLTISDQLTQLHPDCPVLGSLQLRGCLAVAIRDQEGRSIGHLAIAHSGALEQELHHSPVLALYVARVTAELERRVIERENAAMERALGVKHKLESLGLMAGHIAHDFNNLLMAILGNANLASEQLDPGNPGHTYIENIEAAATSAGDVVSQLLDYAGRKPNRVSLLDVSDAVREASRLVELTRDPSISVEYQLAESLPLVEADPAQLQQIVINLVLNAAEALGRRRGVIGIGVAEVSLQVKDIQRLIQGRDLAPGSYVEIQVTDTGVGIDEMTLQRMFDPFFSSKPDGRGLGLSAVRGFVQACGGGLSVTSKLGSGTSISLFLRPAVGKRVAVVPAIIHHRGDRLPILVVDDELLVAQTAAGMLEALGFEVQMALSCEEALALARKKNYGCAVIDIRMPRIDGWTTLRRLRELCPELPAVMMTGYSNQARATELVAKFRVGMLYKPFEAGDLVTAISEVANPAVVAS
jgi:signal transduction histidine kinase/ActR/RegA family two-component response regulator